MRDHAGPETTDLATYRQRHAQHKTDPDLQAAHAAAPWLVVWDDHELQNNRAGDVPIVPQKNFDQRRAAAFRAFYENMPLRRSSAPRGVDLQLYRRARWGRLATYVRATLTADELTADFRCVRRVSQVGARAFTRASFTVHDQQLGLELTHDNPPTDPPRRLSDQAVSDTTIRAETDRP